MSAQIWPGAECLEPKPFEVGEHVLVIGSGQLSEGVIAGFVGPYIAWVEGTDSCGAPRRCAFYRESLRRDYSESHIRTRDIAMAHAMARARMQRFVAWLGMSDTVGGVVVPARYMSPEQAMLDSSLVRHDALFMVGGDWRSRFWLCSNSRILAEDLMGVGRYRERGPTDEWAALPFNQPESLR